VGAFGAGREFGGERLVVLAALDAAVAGAVARFAAVETESADVVFSGG